MSSLYDHPTSQHPDAASASQKPAQPALAPSPQLLAGQPLSAIQDADVLPASDPGEISVSLFDGGTTIDASAAHSTVALAFDPLVREAREAGDAEQERLYTEGQQDVADTMHDLGVGAADAREITSAFVPFLSRSPQSAEELAGGWEKAEAALRAEWKGDTDTKLADARLAYKEAASRLWWLESIVEEQGAGNDVAIVKFFAKQGAKMRKAGRR